MNKACNHSRLLKKRGEGKKKTLVGIYFFGSPLAANCSFPAGSARCFLFSSRLRSMAIKCVCACGSCVSLCKKCSQIYSSSYTPVPHCALPLIRLCVERWSPPPPISTPTSSSSSSAPVLFDETHIRQAMQKIKFMRARY